jgi:tRNA threonylcarbamoyladenosine biosynthesis protein TsaE
MDSCRRSLHWGGNTLLLLERPAAPPVAMVPKKSDHSETARNFGTAVWKFISTSEAETERLAERLADVLEAGTVVALVGNLGVGKTRLVRALCEALGVDRRDIASPTFVLVHEYEGRLPVYHFDTYRLKSPHDFLSLGADEYLTGEGVCLIEWADRVAAWLPADYLRIDIAATGETTRDLVFSAGGPKAAGIIQRLSQRISDCRTRGTQ